MTSAGSMGTGVGSGRAGGWALDLQGEDLAADDACLDVQADVQDADLHRASTRLDDNFVALLEAVVRVQAEEEARLAGREGVGLVELGLHVFLGSAQWLFFL